MIEFYYEQVPDSQVDENIIKSWISKIITGNNSFLGSINYIFCNDDYILDINKQYLNHDYYTDIITFDYCDNKIISGDLFISLDTVLSNSKKFSTTYNQELYRVIIHGILHLLGFKDKSEEEAAEMRNQEELALDLLKTIS